MTGYQNSHQTFQPVWWPLLWSHSISSVSVAFKPLNLLRTVSRQTHVNDTNVSSEARQQGEVSHT